MAVSAENVTVSMIKEATQGVTPATPAWLTTSIVSESLVLDPSFTESEMITGGTRGIKDYALTGVATSGDVTRELVYEQNTLVMFEAALGNAFGNDPHGNTTTADQVYDYTDLISISIEKDFDVSGASQYHRYLGQVPSSMSIEFAPGEIISHTTSFIGLEQAIDDTIVTGATYVPEDGNSSMTAPKVTSMAITTVDTTTPVAWMSTTCFTSLTLALENNTRALACIGTLEAREIALGRINVTGSGSIYFAAEDPFVSLLAETEYGLLIASQDTQGNSYEFYLPRCKFTVANANVTGQSTDVMTEFTLQGLQSTVSKYTIRISKADTVVAVASTPAQTPASTSKSTKKSGAD